MLLAFKGVLELENGLLLKGVGNIIRELHVGDDYRLDVDTFVRHNLSKMLDHGLGLLVTSDALNLSGADTADHVSNSLSDCSLKHLIQFTDIHAKIVNIVTISIDIKHHRYIDLYILIS